MLYTQINPPCNHFTPPGILPTNARSYSPNVNIMRSIINIPRTTMILMSLSVCLYCCQKEVIVPLTEEQPVTETEPCDVTSNSWFCGTCPYTAEPVCGCNGETYANSCFAQVSGVPSWVDGPCSTACIDSSLIQDYPGYDYHDIYGLPTIGPAIMPGGCFPTYPPTPSQPVCGCDGNTYNSATDALYGHGVTSWTDGPCPIACIDSSLIGAFMCCELGAPAVCGCDGITYANGCEAATTAGITSWTTGPCSAGP